MPEESPTIALSVVLPCYNEVGNIDHLVDELLEVLGATGRPFEILYVDDNSTDGSFEKLQDRMKSTPCLRAVRHHSNFGQSAAFLTGFALARGEYVITLDADGQNDPHDIPRLLAAVDAGADCAVGTRTNRQDTWSKKVSSRVANVVRGWVLRDSIQDAGCSFRLMRRDMLQELPSFKALHRFLPTILEWRGMKIAQIPIHHRARTSGVSKYGIGNRLWVGIKDMIGLRWYRKRMLMPNRLSE